MTGSIINDDSVVVLFSGGADSVLLLHLAMKIKKRIFAVLIDYEQLHGREIKVAEAYLKDTFVPYLKVDLKNYKVDSALTGSGEKGKYKNVSVWNVPARNTIFLSIAAGIAEAEGTEKVWIGCDYSDREGLFKDCYQEYFVKLNELFAVAFSYPIKVEAPLLGFTKEMVVQMLLHFGVDMDKIFSGYGGL